MNWDMTIGFLIGFFTFPSVGVALVFAFAPDDAP